MTYQWGKSFSTLASYAFNGVTFSTDGTYLALHASKAGTVSLIIVVATIDGSLV